VRVLPDLLRSSETCAPPPLPVVRSGTRQSPRPGSKAPRGAVQGSGPQLRLKSLLEDQVFVLVPAAQVLPVVLDVSSHRGAQLPGEGVPHEERDLLDAQHVQALQLRP
jgi:hypothetical protein